MYSTYYKLITWTEDMWLPNQEENMDYVSAQAALEIAAEDGFMPIGPPTCGFVKLEEGVRFYFSQAFFREYKNILRSTSKNINRESKEEILDLLVSELDLNKRVMNCLLAHGIRKVKDLVDCHRIDLIKMPNLGKKSITNVCDALADVGLSLKTIEDK
jgi:hypothetical protein